MRELTLREQLLLGLLLLIGLAFGGVYVQKQLAGQEALLPVSYTHLRAHET